MSAKMYSAEDARQEADRHRREINETLDVLNARVSRGISKAEEQVNKPVNWLRAHPWATIALSVGTGFLLAGSSGHRRHRIDPRLLQEMERAYLEGRVDERQNLPTRRVSDWQKFAAHLDGIGRTSLAHLLVSLSQPLVRGAGYGLANLFGKRLSDSNPNP